MVIYLFPSCLWTFLNFVIILLSWWRTEPSFSFFIINGEWLVDITEFWYNLNQVSLSSLLMVSMYDFSLFVTNFRMTKFILSCLHIVSSFLSYRVWCSISSKMSTISKLLRDLIWLFCHFDMIKASQSLNSEWTVFLYVFLSFYFPTSFSSKMIWFLSKRSFNSGVSTCWS